MNSSFYILVLVVFVGYAFPFLFIKGKLLERALNLRFSKFDIDDSVCGISKYYQTEWHLTQMEVSL